MKIKVVYNDCFGGFGLSREAQSRLENRIGDKPPSYQVDRHDPSLVAIVEEMGDKANGAYAELKIKEIEGDRYIIEEYDGSESVQTPDDIRWTIVD